MKFPRSVLLGALFFSLFASEGSAFKKKSPDCGDGPEPMRVTVRHIDPNGIGYNQGYTTAEGFFSLYNGWDDWVLFLDARMHIFNTGRPALNAGVGTRYVTDSRIWGVNTYYDYRKTRRQHYNQLTAGFESLGAVWDFRCNGYAPVGKTRSPYYKKGFAYFEGNRAIIGQRYEYAMAGFNAEAGAHVDNWDRFPLYFAGGPYYLTGKGGTTWGGQTRASVTIYEYLKVDANLSYDHMFKWIGQGQVGISFSFGGKKPVKKKCDTSCPQSTAIATRAYQSVDRFEIIAVNKKTKHSTAINPLTGQPYNFLFVNNLNHSAGTYESPYSTLATAESNSNSHDVIYVFPGDSTTTGMTAGIVLKDYQRLWGSSVGQNLPTTAGNIVIPAQSTGVVQGIVVAPIITNTAANVVTLANNNEISGFFLENAASGDIYSIYGDGVTNATVLNCTMAGANTYGYQGISVTEVSGTLTVDNCVFNQQYGIYLSNTTTNLQANISNSNFSYGSASSINWVLTSAAQGTLNVESCILNASNNAIEVDSSGTSSIVATVNNSNLAAGGKGIYLNATGGTPSQTLSASGNAINTYYQPVSFTLLGTLNATVVGNTMNSVYPCVEIDMTAGNGTFVAINNTMATNDDYGVYLNQTGGTLDATFTRNTVSVVEDDYAFYCVGSGTSQTLNISGNTISGEYGAYLEQTAGSYSVIMNNNLVFSNEDEYGVYFSTGGAGNASLSMMNNELYGDYAVDCTLGSTGDVSLSFMNNLMNGDVALYISQTTGSPTTTLTATGNSFEGYQPVNITQATGAFTATVSNNSIIGQGGNGYVYSASGAVSSTQTITGNTITASSSGHAINLISATTGTVTATVTGNTLSSSVNPSFLSTMTAAGTQSLNVSDNIVTNSAGYSLAISDGTAAWTVNGNQFIANNTTPVTATATASGVVSCMQLNNNAVYPLTSADAYVITGTMANPITLNPPTGNTGNTTLLPTYVNQTTCP